MIQRPISEIHTVNCPRKGPMGNEVSVIKCVQWHRGSPAECGACQKFLVSEEAARFITGEVRVRPSAELKQAMAEPDEAEEDDDGLDLLDLLNEDEPKQKRQR